MRFHVPGVARHRALLLAGMFCLWSGRAGGQVSTGAITGIVTDSSGSVIPGAKVTAINRATNVPTTSTTNESGNYALLYLVPGPYLLTVEHPGFGKLVRRETEIRVGDELKIDLQLSLGSMAQTVVVEGGTPLLQAENGSVGQTITHSELEGLPLPDGNPFILTRLVAGAVFTGDPQFTRPFDNGSVSSIRVNGAEGGNEFSLNGLPNNGNQLGNSKVVAYVPPSDAVQEFKMTTSSFTAQSGHSAASSIDVSTKSGTNTLHGSLYEFFRNEKLSANDFFSNSRNQPKNTVRYNRFGGSVGGPVFLPKIYHGRNKTFFFVVYEGIRDVFPAPGFFTVPSLAERKGDFSEICATGFTGGICNDRDNSGRIINQIWDPASAHPCGGSGEPCNGTNSAAVWRDPFPGNLLCPPPATFPCSAINPIALNLLKFYPLPNTTALADGSNNFFSQQSRWDKYHNELVRLDHVISTNQKLAGTYYSNWRYESRFDWAGPVNGVHPTGQDLYYINHGIALDDVITFSPTLLLHLSGGYSRFTSQTGSPAPGFDLSTVGFSSGVTALFRGTPYLSGFNINGFSRLAHDLGSTTFGGQFVISNVYSFLPTLTKILGAHTLNFGYDFRVYRENQANMGNSFGYYDFNDDFTKQSDRGSPTSRGQGLASFLLGQPTGGNADRNDSQANQEIFQGLFLQDDWKVSRKLTLNMGLRYEYEGAVTERFNRATRGFDLTSPNPIGAGAQANFAAAFPNGLVVESGKPPIMPSDFHVLGGYLFASPSNRGLWRPNPRNFQPRAGFAYQLKRNTVIRGGWAIYSQPFGITGVHQTGFSQRTLIKATTDAGLHIGINPGSFTGLSTLSNPFPNGVLDPPASSLGLQTDLLDNTVDLRPFNPQVQPKTGHSMAWSLGIQRELTGRWLVDMAYVGRHGYNLARDSNYLNAIPSVYLSTSLTRDTQTNSALSTNVLNPFKGLVPFSTSNTSDRIQARQLLRPFPEFNTITSTVYDGTNTYHALELRVQHRFSHGYQIFTNYTWSKLLERYGILNDFQTVPDHRVSGDDHPHRITGAFIGQFPFGHGRRWGSAWPGWLDAMLGGWQTGAFYQFQSGQPLNNWGNVVYFGPGGCTTYPNCPLGDASKLRTHISSQNLNQTFDISGFYIFDATNVDPKTGLVSLTKQQTDNRIKLLDNIRTFPQALPNLRGPRQNDWNISVQKKFSVTEKTKMEFRSEFLNAFNHPWFSNPNINPTSADFGRITSQRNLAREIELALKLTF